MVIVTAEKYAGNTLTRVQRMPLRNHGGGKVARTRPFGWLACGALYEVPFRDHVLFRPGQYPPFISSTTIKPYASARWLVKTRISHNRIAGLISPSTVSSCLIVRVFRRNDSSIGQVRFLFSRTNFSRVPNYKSMYVSNHIGILIHFLFKS